MTTAERVARTYIEASNRCDYEATSVLFDEDAEWIPISPMQPRRGRPAIREGYMNDVKPTNARIVDDRTLDRLLPRR